MMCRGAVEVLLARPARNSNRVCRPLMLGYVLASLIVGIASSSSLNANTTLNITSIRSVYQVNSTIEIKCTVQQRASADVNSSDVVWSRDGSSLLPEDAEQSLPDAATSLLVLGRAQLGDGGVYKCRLGQDPSDKAAALKIEVGLPTSKATNLKCWSTNYKNIECRWETFDTNLATTHQLMQSRYSNPAYGRMKKCSTSLHLYGNCSLPDDEINKQLWYCVNSSNALSHSISDTFKFQSDVDTITKPARMRSVTAVSSSSLKVYFLPPENFDTFPYPHDLKYLITCVYKGEVKNVTYVPHRDDPCNFTQPCHTVVGLSKPYGLYDVSVRVSNRKTDKSRWSDISEVISARTREAAPQSGVNLDFSCNRLNTSQSEDTWDVRLTWKSFPEEERNGILLAYVINVNGSIHKVGPNDTSYVVTGLNKESYRFTILAQNSVNDSDKTDCIIPPVPAGIVNNSTLVVSIVLPFLLVVVAVMAMLVVLHRIKKSMVHIPDIVIPHHLQSDNLHMFGGRHHPLPREQESFDELKTPNGAFHGQKPPSVCPDSHVLDQLESNRKHPLLSARRTNSLVNENYMKGPTEQEALLSQDLSLLDLDSERNSPDYPQLNDNWKYTALSIKSGGSYAHLREEDDGSYMSMAGPQRGNVDRTSDPLEARPDCSLQDYAGALDPDAMNHLDGMCSYDPMGGPAIHGTPGRSSSTQELLHPSIGQDENCHRPHGLQADIICGVSYADMGRGGNPQLTDKAWITASGGLNHEKQEKPIIKEPSRDRSSPLPHRDLGDAASGDADGSIGSYVKQGCFLSNSPKHPSSRTGSPRVNPRMSCPPAAAAVGWPCEPKQVESHSDIREKFRPDSSGDPCPAESADGLLSPADPDSPDVSSENDVSPYVLNTCTLSGSTEPLLAKPANPSENRVSPNQCGTNIENGIDPEECSLDGEETAPSSYTEDHLTDPAVAGSEAVNRSPSVNCGGYLSLSDLPPAPSPRAPDTPLGEIHGGSNGTKDQSSLGGYITEDQLAGLTSPVTPTNRPQAAKVSPGSGGYVDHDEMLKMISPNFTANPTCNGIQATNRDTRKNDPDSGSVPNTAPTKKPGTKTATETISEADQATAMSC